MKRVLLMAWLAQRDVSVSFYSTVYSKSACVYVSVGRCKQHFNIRVFASGSHAGSFRDPARSVGGRRGPGGPGGSDGTGR